MFCFAFRVHVFAGWCAWHFVFTLLCGMHFHVHFASCFCGRLQRMGCLSGLLCPLGGIAPFELGLYGTFRPVLDREAPLEPDGVLPQGREQKLFFFGIKRATLAASRTLMCSVFCRRNRAPSLEAAQAAAPTQDRALSRGALLSFLLVCSCCRALSLRGCHSAVCPSLISSLPRLSRVVCS